MKIRILLLSLIGLMLFNCSSDYSIRETVIVDTYGSSLEPFHSISIWKEGYIVEQYTIEIDEITPERILQNRLKAEALVDILEGKHPLLNRDLVIIDPNEDHNYKATDSCLSQISLNKTTFYGRLESGGCSKPFITFNKDGSIKDIHLEGYAFIPIDEFYLIRK